MNTDARQNPFAIWDTIDGEIENLVRTDEELAGYVNQMSDDELGLFIDDARKEFSTLPEFSVLVEPERREKVRQDSLFPTPFMPEEIVVSPEKTRPLYDRETETLWAAYKEGMKDDGQRNEEILAAAKPIRELPEQQRRKLAEIADAESSPLAPWLKYDERYLNAYYDSLEDFEKIARKWQADDPLHFPNGAKIMHGGDIARYAGQQRGDWRNTLLGEWARKAVGTIPNAANIVSNVYRRNRIPGAKIMHGGDIARYAGQQRGGVAYGNPNGLSDEDIISYAIDDALGQMFPYMVGSKDFEDLRENISSGRKAAAIAGEITSFLLPTPNRALFEGGMAAAAKAGAGNTLAGTAAKTAAGGAALTPVHMAEIPAPVEDFSVGDYLQNVARQAPADAAGAALLGAGAYGLGKAAQALKGKYNPLYKTAFDGSAEDFSRIFNTIYRRSQNGEISPKERGILDGIAARAREDGINVQDVLDGKIGARYFEQTLRPWLENTPILKDILPGWRRGYEFRETPGAVEAPPKGEAFDAEGFRTHSAEAVGATRPPTHSGKAIEGESLTNREWRIAGAPKFSKPDIPFYVDEAQTVFESPKDFTEWLMDTDADAERIYDRFKYLGNREQLWNGDYLPLFAKKYGASVQGLNAAPKRATFKDEALQAQKIVDSIPDDDIAMKIEAIEATEPELLSDSQLDWAVDNGLEWAGEEIVRRQRIRDLREASAGIGLLDRLDEGGIKLPTPKSMAAKPGSLAAEMRRIYDALPFDVKSRYFTARDVKLDEVAGELGYESEADFINAVSEAFAGRMESLGKQGRDAEGPGGAMPLAYVERKAPATGFDDNFVEAKNLDYSQPVEIVVNGIELPKGLNSTAMGKWAKNPQNNILGEALNLDTNIPYRISGETINKIASSRKGETPQLVEAKFALLANIKELVQKAKKTGELRKSKGDREDPDLMRLNVFHVPFRHGKNLYRVRIIGKEFKPELDRLVPRIHSGKIDEILIEKEGGLRGFGDTPESNRTVALPGGAPETVTLGRMLGKEAPAARGGSETSSSSNHEYSQPKSFDITSGKDAESQGDSFLTVQREIDAGKKAMESVIARHEDIKDAIFRQGLGRVSFYWGNPGVLKNGRLVRGGGISHLIAQRNLQGENGYAVAMKMPEVILRGDIGKVYGPKGGERVNISFDGHTAVLSKYKDGKSENWIVTGWKNWGDGGVGGAVNAPENYAVGNHGISSRQGAPSLDKAPTARGESETGSSSNHEYSQLKALSKASEKASESQAFLGGYIPPKFGGKPKPYKEPKSPAENPDAKLWEREKKGEGHLKPRRIRPDTPAPSGTPSAGDIRRYFEKALDIPIRAKVGRKTALGLYYNQRETIRLKDGYFNDIRVFSHEIGHDIHEKLFPAFRRKAGALDNFKSRPDVRRELYNLATKRFGDAYKPEKRVGEGVAEFMHDWLKDPALAAENCPNFFRLFTEQLEKYPDVKHVLETGQKLIKQHYKAPALERVRSSIKSSSDVWEKKSVSERMGDFVRRGLAEWENELHPLWLAQKELKELGADAHFYDLATNYKGGALGKAQYSIMDASTDLWGREVGPSLKQILDRVGSENMDDFAAYLVARRALSMDESQSGIALADAKAVVDELGEKFERPARLLQNFQDQQLKLLYDSGYLTAAAYEKMKKANRNYVPFYRFREALSGTGGPRASQGFVNTANPVKRFSGSEREIMNPLESVIKNALLFRDMAERNVIADSFVSALEGVQGSGRIAEPFFRKMEPTKLRPGEIKDILEQSGLADDLQVRGEDGKMRPASRAEKSKYLATLSSVRT